MRRETHTFACVPSGVLLTLLEAEDVVCSLRKTCEMDEFYTRHRHNPQIAAGLQITSAYFWASYQVNTHLYARKTLIKPQLLVFVLLPNDLVFTKTLTWLCVLEGGGLSANFFCSPDPMWAFIKS